MLFGEGMYEEQVDLTLVETLRNREWIVPAADETLDRREFSSRFRYELKTNNQFLLVFRKSWIFLLVTKACLNA